MESRGSRPQELNLWDLCPAANQQEIPDGPLKDRNIPCSPSPSDCQFQLPPITSFENRKFSTRHLLSLAPSPKVSSLTLLHQSNTPKSRLGCRSISTSTDSNGTVEIHEEGHIEWGLQDSELEPDTGALDRPASQIQRAVCDDWRNERSSRLMLSENAASYTDVQPFTLPDEADLTATMHQNSTKYTTTGSEDERNRALEYQSSLVVQDEPIATQIYASIPQHPSLTITAPNDKVFVLSKSPRLNNNMTKEQSDSPEVSKRHISGASMLSSGSPRDSPRMWLRRDISSGRYFIERVSTPAASEKPSFAAFDMTSDICAIPAISEGEGVTVRFHVRLSFMWSENFGSSNLANLKIVVKHARLSNQEVRLEPGTNSVMLSSNQPPLVEEIEKPATITIIRHGVDFEESLNVYLAVFYPITRRQVAVRLPSFRPLLGSVPLECILVKEPCLPLTMEPSVGDICSAWNIEKKDGHGIIFDRIAPLPRISPEAFVDDVSVRFQELQPAKFARLESLDPSTVTIWNLAMTVGKILGNGIYCSLRLDLAVGHSQTLLVVDAHGWTPIYCLLNGQPAREKSNLWFVDEKKRYILAKQLYMAEGQVIEVDLHWQRSWIDSRRTSASHEIVPLPSIANNSVAGGKLTCTLPAATINLKNPTSTSYLQTFFNNTTVLPILESGHEITLTLSNLSINSALPATSPASTSTNGKPVSGRIQWADRHSCDLHAKVSEPVSHGLIHASDGRLEDVPEDKSIDDDSSSDHSGTSSDQAADPSATPHLNDNEPPRRSWIECFRSVSRWIGYLSLITFIIWSITNFLASRRPHAIKYSDDSLVILGSRPPSMRSVTHGYLLPEWLADPRRQEKGTEEETEARHIATHVTHENEVATQKSAIEQPRKNYYANDKVKSGSHQRDGYSDPTAGEDSESYRDKIDRYIGWALLANHA